MDKKTEPVFNDHPLITYSNRIQKHMLELTRELSYSNMIGTEEKRKLKLIIANLPPQAKEKLQNITTQLESKQVLTIQNFDTMYGTVSDWIYINILRDAFKIQPLSSAIPHLGEGE